MLSIESKVIEYSKITGMGSNNIEPNILQDCAETITDMVDQFNILTISEFNEILDEHLVNFKNPEYSAIKSYVCDELKILGYSFGYDQIFKK